MAGITDWTLAGLAPLPALLIAVPRRHGVLAGRRPIGSGVAVLCLELITFACDQSAFIDLPLRLALLTLPGTFLLALFLERWL
nr:hypothetical protein [uncultured Lichenicoccus sp.]